MSTSTKFAVIAAVLAVLTVPAAASAASNFVPYRDTPTSSLQIPGDAYSSVVNHTRHSAKPHISRYRDLYGAYGYSPGGPAQDPSYHWPNPDRGPYAQPCSGGSC